MRSTGVTVRPTALAGIHRSNPKGRFPRYLFPPRVRRRISRLTPNPQPDKPPPMFRSTETGRPHAQRPRHSARFSLAAARRTKPLPAAACLHIHNGVGFPEGAFDDLRAPVGTRGSAA